MGIPSLKELVAVWLASVAEFYPEHKTGVLVPSEVTPKEKGMLAGILQRLNGVYGGGSTLFDFRPHACSIIALAVGNWISFTASAGGYKAPAKPQIESPR